MRVWRYDPARDEPPSTAEPGDLDARRAVFVAARTVASPPAAWMAIDDYDRSEATILFGAPPGDQFREYIRALLPVAIEEAAALGFTSLLAHWRGGWSSAKAALAELGFEEGAPGMWRRALGPRSPAVPAIHSPEELWAQVAGLCNKLRAAGQDEAAQRLEGATSISAHPGEVWPKTLATLRGLVHEGTPGLDKATAASCIRYLETWP